MEIIDFGVSPYREIWDKQNELFASLVERKQLHLPIDVEYLLIGEHYNVYTLGFHGNADNLLVSPQQLAESGTEVIRIERGGDITYHGPGQLIVYPIIDLESRNLGIKDYMWLLEECVIELIGKYGIKGERVDGATGVWIDKCSPFERKICAMGVKCRRHISMHGLALNVTTDLSAFGRINPCGFVNKGVTSLKKELTNSNITLPAMDEVKRKFIEIFNLYLAKNV